MSLELVLLVPVLVLLTLFVLWAGRGGRAGLTADLAAEEAATAAALCCEEGEAFESDRDALVAELLASRPGLQFLCIGGLQPAAPADGGAGAPDEFVQEHWLDFEASEDVSSGGVGVLGVRFACETDGAVAPLRGLFPTVTFHGQAAEVVVRRPPPPGIGFESSRFVAAEGPGSRELVFTVTSLDPVAEEVVVSYQIAAGSTATGGAGLSQACSSAPDDYRTLTTSQARILNGQREVEIRVALFDDDCYEGEFETLTLEILGLFKSDGTTPLPADVGVLDSNRDIAEGRIYEDDIKPYLFIVPVTKSPCEVVEADTPLDFEVRLRGVNGVTPAPNADPVTVQVATIDVNTNTPADTDYMPLSPNPTTLTFDPGVVDQTVTVTIKDDVSSPAAEDDETFELEMSNPTGGVPLDSTTKVTCTIEDDEVRVTAAAASADEGDDINFELMLDRTPTSDFTVSYSLMDYLPATNPNGADRGTSACAGSDDYLDQSGTLTVQSGHSHLLPVSVPAVTTCQDLRVEADETFWLEISIPTGSEALAPAPAGAVGTILNDDIPVVSISPASAQGTEGNDVRLTVTLDDGNGQALELANTITVDYDVGGSGADAAADPGQTGADYSVELNSSPLTSSTLTGTLTFAAVAVVQQHVFDVELEADYEAESSETLRLDLDNLVDALGQAVFEDRDNDPLTDDSHAEVTILDDPPPVFSVSDFTGDEGTDQAFTVTLARPRAGEDPTVDYQIAGFAPPGGLAATDPATGVTHHDYEAAYGAPTCSSTGSLTGTLDFSGKTTDTVEVCLRLDAIKERPETLGLTLSNPTKAVIADPVGEGTIIDQDAPRLYVSNASVDEGGVLVFTVTLCNPPRQGNPPVDVPVTVDYQTVTRSATSGRDFTVASGTLTFDSTVPTQKICGTAPNLVDGKSLTVSVQTLIDTIEESVEELYIVLNGQSPFYVALANAIGVGQIINVSAATVRVGNPSAKEGSPLGFVISLEDNDGNPAKITKDVTVYYATADGTATAGADYTSVPASPQPCRTQTLPLAGCPSVTFSSAGSVRTHTVSVSTSTDNLDESDETVSLGLRLAPGTDNAGLGDSTGTGTIVDAPPPYVRIDDPAGVDEGGTVTFTVSLHDRSGAAVAAITAGEVAWATADRTATAAATGNLPGKNDYTAGSGFVDFAVGDQQKTITVTTLTDSVAEPTETFRVDLSAPRNAILDQAVGVGTINANLTPKLSVSDASADEGQDLQFTVTLDAASASTVTVDYATSDGTATTADGDYTAASGTLTFSPGDTTKTVDVVTSDDSDTGDETVQLVLSNPTNADLDDATGVGTILAATLPTLSIADASGAEGSDMRFVVTLSKASADQVSFDVNTRDGTATAPSDYEPVADTTSSIAAGSTQAFVDVEIKSDTVGQADEYVETFYVDLSNPTNATIADGTAAGDIKGDLDCVNMIPDPDPDAPPPDPLPTVSITAAEADEDDGQMDSTLTVTQAMCQDIEFRLTVSDDTRSGSRTATLNADYLQPRTVWLSRGQTSVGFSVPLIDDDIVEGDETFQITASARMPGRRPLATQQPVYLKIVDDDESTLQLPADGTVSVNEGSWMSFVISLDKPNAAAVTFDYATSDGSAPAATKVDDYEEASGSRTISAGDLSTTVAVRTYQDSIDESDENVNLTVSNISGAEPDPDGNTAVGVIIDDDRAPAASVSDASADEGQDLQFTVTLDAASGRELTVNWGTRNGVGAAGATAGSDYTAGSGMVTFAAGDTSETVTVATLTDDIVESTERMFVDLSRSSLEGPSIADGIGVGEIRDVTNRNVSVSDAFVTEGGTLAFEVSFTGAASSRDITMKYRTRAGTAVAGTDYDNAYESAAQELKIVAGDTSVDVLVPTVQDQLDESNETLELLLSDPVGAVITDGTAAGLIIDDDPLPGLRVGDASASEADPGDPVVKATFTLSLSEPSGRDVTVTYSTADGTATDPEDYTAKSGTQTIAAGDRQATVDVNLVNDDVAENVERFQLRASAAVNASLDDSVGVATITDDDGSPQILVDDPADVYEGAGASTTFRVRLSRAAADEVTVAYVTEDATAKAGDDYTAVSGTLTFSAGQTSKTVTVALVNDDVGESSETFRLKLSSASSNAVLGDDTATALILDDDGLPTLSVADAAAQTEGSTSSFTVSLSRSSARAATVAYATRDDPTAGSAAAVPALDYTAASGTVTIPARSTSATVTVNLLDDSFDEHTETFWLRLSSPTGATIVDGTAVGTINDDDPLPKLKIADASAGEGSDLSFAVSMDAASGRTVAVPWATRALSPGTKSALPGSDYTAVSGTATFVSGATTAQVTVTSLADDLAEEDERFTVQLGTPTSAVLDDAAAVGTIIDDDSEPRVSIADTSVDEDSGPAEFKVTLSRASGLPVTVGYSTADVTATDPDDYAPAAVRTLTIPAASTEGLISVAIVDDDLAEGAETFTVTLANPTNAVIASGAGTATGTIVDDEGEPQLTISDADECEDGSTLDKCQIRACATHLRPNWDWWIDSYEEYQSYVADCEEILADHVPDECQDLSDRYDFPSNCYTVIGQLALDFVGDGKIEFPVVLNHASTEDISVRYTTFDGSASSPSDYVAATGTLTIPAGDTSASILVTLVDRGTNEVATETFRLRLDDPVGVELASAEAVGTILDDDHPPFLPSARAEAYANESDDYLYHHIRLDRPSDLTVTADYYFYIRTHGFDHPGVEGYPGIDTTTGTITFAPGVVEQTIAVPVIDNSIETWFPGYGPFTVTYGIGFDNIVNAHYGWGSVFGTIWDDETDPYIERITATDTLESEEEVVFVLKLNRFPDKGKNVTAFYETLNGTDVEAATAGSDYTAVQNKSVTIRDDAITATVAVQLIDDTEAENDEYFFLQIDDDNPGNRNLTVNLSHYSDEQELAWIIDDDTDPEMSVEDTRANEDADTVPFWVELSQISATDVTVDYATADGTATAGSDYTSASGTLTIPAGLIGDTVSVTILDDEDDDEDNETFTLELTNPIGATIADGSATATATIIEDHDLPLINAKDVNVIEGTTVDYSGFGFVARISSEDLQDYLKGKDRSTVPSVYVDWKILEVPSLGDRAAKAGEDYRACGYHCSYTSDSSGTITINLSAALDHGYAAVEVFPDFDVERDERLQFVLSNPRGAKLGKSSAWATIVNDDLPIVSVADVSASESEAAVVFTLRLHDDGLDPSSLYYTTVARPSAGDLAASPGDDYTTTSGTLNFAAGVTTATISVPIIADSSDEYDETFLLQLSSPKGLVFRDAAAVGTITDDDDGWWINDRSVREDAGTMVFTIERDHTSDSAETVNYRFGSGGSAVAGTSCTSGVDFVYPSGSSTGSVTVPAADKSVTLSVTICDDTTQEGRENLEIVLVLPDTKTSRKPTGVGTIVDNDTS